MSNQGNSIIIINPNRSTSSGNHHSRPKKRKSFFIRHKIVFTSIILCMCVFTAVLTVRASSTDSAQYETYYKSVEIKPGDSLWSISKEYTDGSAKQINRCINEICDINDITRFTTIKAGYHIIVPYTVKTE